MCKIFLIAGIKPEVQDKAVRLIKTMGDEMTPQNTDGIGYAAVDSEGNLFAERWLNNSDRFKTTLVKPKEHFFLSKFSKALTNNTAKAVTYTKYGEPDLNKAVAVTLHTRMATSGRGMENTHPFIDMDTSLIHNGVINNTEDFKFSLSNCDSESILISYLREGVNIETSKMTEAAAALSGYYACGVFSRDANNKRIMDVFKGHNDRLYWTFINELDTWTITTSGLDVRDACKKVGLTCGESYQMQDGVILRFDPVSGDLLSETDFKVGSQYKTYSNRSYEGYHTYNHNTHRSEPAKVTHLPAKRGLTNEEIDYLKQPPTIKVWNDRESQEYLDVAGYYQ